MSWNKISETFVRYRWLLITATFALLTASFASALIEKNLLVPAQIPTVTPQLSARSTSVELEGFQKLLETSKPAGVHIPATLATPSNNRPSVAGGQPPIQGIEGVQLQGTILSDQVSLAMLLIQGESKILAVGEPLGEYLLNRVEDQSVTFMHNGRPVILEMSGDTQASATPRLPGPNSPRTRINSPQATIKGGKSTVFSQKELRAIIDNPAKYAGQFRMLPAKRDGEIVGMSVNFKDVSHPLYRVGLRTGDIVKGINGRPLKGPEDLSEAYRILRNTPNINFSVERNGSEIPINVQLQ